MDYHKTRRSWILSCKWNLMWDSMYNFFSIAITQSKNWLTQHTINFYSVIALELLGRRNSSQQKFLSWTLKIKINNSFGQTDHRIFHFAKPWTLYEVHFSIILFLRIFLEDNENIYYRTRWCWQDDSWVTLLLDLTLLQRRKILNHQLCYERNY